MPLFLTNFVIKLVIRDQRRFASATALADPEEACKALRSTAGPNHLSPFPTKLGQISTNNRQPTTTTDNNNREPPPRRSPPSFPPVVSPRRFHPSFPPVISTRRFHSSSPLRVRGACKSRDLATARTVHGGRTTRKSYAFIPLSFKFSGANPVTIQCISTQGTFF